MRTKKTLLMVCLFQAITTLYAYAADEALVRKLVAKTGFRAAVEQNIRNNRSMALKAERLEEFVSTINMKAIEDAYVKSLAQQLTNEEIRTLQQAYDLPGYETAAFKQGIAAASVLGVIMREFDVAANKTSVTRR